MKTGNGRETLIKRIRDKIVLHYNPEKIILFGSHAHGKPSKESDLDLFIVKRTRKHPVERIREVSELFPNRNFSLDIIVRTPEEVERRLSWGDFFYREIVEKGRVLYDKEQNKGVAVKKRKKRHLTNGCYASPK